MAYTFVVVPTFIVLMCCRVCCVRVATIGLAKSYKEKAGAMIQAMKAHTRGRGGRPDLAEPLIV